jgi:hypothetical protein
MRYTVATIEVIFDELRVFGGYVSAFSPLSITAKAGFPSYSPRSSVTSAAFLSKVRPPIQAAQDCLTAFPPVFECNARDLRSYEFIRAIVGGCWRGSGGRFFRLFVLPISEEGKHGGDRNAANKFADPVRQECKRTRKEQRGGDP